MIEIRSRTLPLALALLGVAAGLLAVATPAAAATLAIPTWSTSKSATGATSATYKYTFTTATSSSLSSVTMTVPSGTAGTPAVASVSPSGINGGTVALAGSTLTYSFTAATVATGTAISISISGLTNTSTAGASTSTIATKNGAGSVDTGTTGSVIFTSSQLTSLGWSASSTTVGATGVSYTYTFTTASLAVVTSVTMTVPPGTGGTPTIGTVSPTLLGATVARSGNVLTVSGISTSIAGGTAVSIQVNGLTNTATAGGYTTEIATNSLLGPVDTGIAGPVSFTGTLTLTSPSSLSWATTLTGSTQNVTDPISADQQFSAGDQTGSGAGWHITVSGTTFTNGAKTLPNSGTFVMTGSLSSVTATTAPTAACDTSCTPPSNSTTYPVAITTASSPTPVTVFDVAAGSGLGPMTIGGHSAANPVGWWVVVPGNAVSGSYTSTITVAVVSGP